MKMYFELFICWFKLGLFTFGGGYAMLPLIQKEIIDKRHWATEEEILDYFAIAQCTPGIIAVNTATFVGYYKKGILGGIIATLGVITPSIIIIGLIATVLPNFMEIKVVQHALTGISVGVCVLLVFSIAKLWQGSIKVGIGYFIFFLALVMTMFFKTPTVWVVILAGVCGLIFTNLKKLEEDDE